MWSFQLQFWFHFISKYLKMSDWNVPAWYVSTMSLTQYHIFLCFSEEIYSESVFSGIVVVSKTWKHCQKGFGHLFSIPLSSTAMPARAGTIQTCRQVLCLYWPLTARGFQASRGFMAWLGEHRKSRLQCCNKQHKRQRATYLNCWFRACFLIRG